MKNLLPLLWMVVASNLAYSQPNSSDLNGKKLSSKNRSILNGQWKSNSGNIQMELDINVEKRDVSIGPIKFNTDYFIVNITKFIQNGTNQTSHFKSLPITFMFLEDEKYHSIIKDPVTGIDIYATLKLVNKNTIWLSWSLPEMDVKNDFRKGTIFPKTVTLLKK